MTTAAAFPTELATTSEAVARHCEPSVPLNLRLMAARGLAPMSPRDLVTAQFVLSFDADARVAEHAAQSLTGLDPRIANAVLADPAVPPPVLGRLAELHASHDAYIEKLLLNPSTPTEVFPVVAAACSEPVAEIIANNQARLLETPEIVRGLIDNPHALKSTVDRVIDFLVRNGVVLDGLHEFEDALLRLGANERLSAASHFDIPRHLLDERLLSDAERQALEAKGTLLSGGEEGREDDDDPNLPLEERLRRAPLPGLIAYATKGNKQVRKILMRHSNRLVALAAITSPMVQEPEVVEAVNSKVTHQEVVTHIAKDKRTNWVRLYPVKLGLVNNPKTPLAIAMRLVPLLNPRDIKALSRSKNIPIGVRTQAANLSRRS